MSQSAHSGEASTRYPNVAKRTLSEGESVAKSTSSGRNLALAGQITDDVRPLVARAPNSRCINVVIMVRLFLLDPKQAVLDGPVPPSLSTCDTKERGVRTGPHRGPQAARGQLNHRSAGHNPARS